MKKTLILNDGSNNCCKSINRHIINELKESHDIVFNKCHGKLFHIQQKLNPKLTLWSASEYTQEFHDYIVDYHQNVEILLIADIAINNPQLVDFLNQTNVKIIQSSRHQCGLKNIIFQYDYLYEDSIFYNTNQNRNGKIVALLSYDNDINQKLNEITYPNNIDHKIIALGNPEFKSPINLGIFNSPDLAFILNRFSAAIDLSGQYRLECQACDISYFQTDNLTDSIQNNLFVEKLPDLQSLTYKNFVNNQLLPHIRSKV